MQNFRTQAVWLILFLVVGCASETSYQKMQAELPALSSDNGRIYIYTRIRADFLDFSPNVLVNGEPVGQSRSGTFLVVDRRPGSYTIEAAKEASFSAFGGQMKSEPARISLVAGQSAYVRLHVVNSEYFVQVKAILEDPAAAHLELSTLSYEGGNALPAGN
ncbi:MAG: DUF2846 domain-containing protein [Myxococcota bacterium]